MYTIHDTWDNCYLKNQLCLIGHAPSHKIYLYIYIYIYYGKKNKLEPVLVFSNE